MSDARSRLTSCLQAAYSLNKHVTESDPELAAIMAKEKERQLCHLELIASEVRPFFSKESMKILIF